MQTQAENTADTTPTTFTLIAKPPRMSRMGKRSATKERVRPKDSAAHAPSAQRDAPLSTAVASLGIPLKLLVFWAGAVLMGLEIAGSRVLAPHFGNSVFVWGSLISVVLIALSAGYYVGGRIADRFPSRILLNSICVAVALWIFAVAALSHGVCKYLVEAGMGERGGPLVASFLLFLPPSIGMGMVSPFAIRLAAQSLATVGKISGSLYALSTMGSIAGTLLTTFLLIPLIGLSAILKGLALVLLLVSVVTLPLNSILSSWRKKKGESLAMWSLLAFVSLTGLFWPAPQRVPLSLGERNILDVDTPYHHISVIESQLDKSRQLRFDRYVESAIATDPPYRSLSSYTYYFHLAFLVQPKIERALFIGAGGGVGPRTFHMHNGEMLIDVVDIDPKVLEIAQTQFHLEDSPQIRTIARDGRMFLRNAEGKYDCIILDAFTIGGRIPFHLVTTEFFELCRDKLNDDGVFVMNINSAVEGPFARIYHSMYRTLDAVFPHTYAFALDYRQRGVDQSMNIILLSTRRDERISPEQFAERAQGYTSSSYVTGVHVRRMVGDLLPNPPDVSHAPVFSDDYAPIDTMPF